MGLEWLMITWVVQGDMTGSFYADVRYLYMWDSRTYGNIHMDLTILNYASYVSSGKAKARESLLKGIKPKTLDWGRQVGVDHRKTNVDEEISIDIIILWRDILMDYCDARG